VDDNDEVDRNALVFNEITSNAEAEPAHYENADTSPLTRSSCNFFAMVEKILPENDETKGLDTSSSSSDESTLDAVTHFEVYTELAQCVMRQCFFDWMADGERKDAVRWFRKTEHTDSMAGVLPLRAEGSQLRLTVDVDQDEWDDLEVRLSPQIREVQSKTAAYHLPLRSLTRRQSPRLSLFLINGAFANAKFQFKVAPRKVRKVATQAMTKIEGRMLKKRGERP
jgi:hypothetical protein